MGSCILDQVPLMTVSDPASVVSLLGASVFSSVKWEDASCPGCQPTMQDKDWTPAERQASAGAWNPGTTLERSASSQAGQRLRVLYWEWVHSVHGVRMQDRPHLLTGTTVYSTKPI